MSHSLRMYLTFLLRERLFSTITGENGNTVEENIPLPEESDEVVHKEEYKVIPLTYYIGGSKGVLQNV